MAEASGTFDPRARSVEPSGVGSGEVYLKKLVLPFDFVRSGEKFAADARHFHKMPVASLAGSKAGSDQVPVKCRRPGLTTARRAPASGTRHFFGACRLRSRQHDALTAAHRITIPCP